MKSEGGFLAPWLPGAVTRALDFLLPPLCFSCGAEVEEQGGLCPSCWSNVRFITKPFCASCGFPFAHDMPDGVLCAPCHQKKPLFSAARAAIAYNRDSRPIVLSFKHGGRTEGLKTMAKWLEGAISGLPRPDVIIPVPLHGKRLFKRTFNQAALLADALALRTGIPSDPFVLERVKNTRTQGGLTRVQRRENVRAAFKVRPDAIAGVKGKTALLIDDVYTTGATVENCARALNIAKAKAVYVVTLARVVEPLAKSPPKKKTKTNGKNGKKG